MRDIKEKLSYAAKVCPFGFLGVYKYFLAYDFVTVLPILYFPNIYILCEKRDDRLSFFCLFVCVPLNFPAFFPFQFSETSKRKNYL